MTAALLKSVEMLKSLGVRLRRLPCYNKKVRGVFLFSFSPFSNLTAVTPFGGFRVSGDRKPPHRGVAQFGRALALGASGRRFKSYRSDLLNITTMQVYSVEHWQENWEELMDRVENGEHIGVTNGENTAIMIPADDELIRMYTDHNEGS